MITTVTMNPCIDMTLGMESLVTGQLNMVSDSRVDYSGKGINVSKVLRALAVPTMCTGILFDGNGAALLAHLDELSIACDFVPAPGNIRTNYKVVDRTKSEMTELNSRGEPVDSFVLQQLIEKIEQHARSSRMVVMSGRIPNGADEDIYRRCMARLRALDVRIIIDAERGPLLAALAEKPFLIKPNAFELAGVMGMKTDTKMDIIAAARQAIKQGAQHVCVSMGERGAMLVTPVEAWYAPALDIAVKGFQGAGDSMVAGICRAVYEDLGPEGMLTYGMAAAAGSITREGTLLCTAKEFADMLPRVRVERVE